MQITLPPELEKYVEDQVKAGVYPTPDAVVENALETLKIQQASLPSGEELRRLVAEGQAAADRGEFVDGHEAIQRIFQRSVARRA